MTLRLLSTATRRAAATTLAILSLTLSSCGDDSTVTPGDENPVPENQPTELRYVDVEITGILASGDFDGDGFVDLVFAIRTLDGHPAGGNIDMFQLTYGDGAGGFSGITEIVRLGSSDSTKRGHTLVAADINGDLIDDFAFAAGNVLEVFAGDSARNHTAIYRTDLVSRVIGQPIYAVDADRDNDLDLLTLHFDLMLQHNDSGAFVNTDTFDSPLLAPINFITGKFSDDDLVDVLAVGMPNIDDLALGLFTGDGGGGFNSPDAVDPLSSDLFLGGFVFDNEFKELAAGDFDGDGDLDAALTSTTNFVQILINNGSGRFSPGQRVIVGDGPTHLRVGDFDKDGELDLASTNQNSKTVVISLGNGDGTFSNTTGTAGGSIEIVLDTDFDLFDVNVADLDGDGFLDLILAEDGSNPPDTGRGSIQLLFGPGR